jgi:glycosyltransferase involved in cell wall biosynthesis
VNGRGSGITRRLTAVPTIPAQSGPRGPSITGTSGKSTASGTVAVILASANRRQLLGEVIADLRTQTADFVLVLSVPDDGSLPSDAPDRPWRRGTAKGLAAQRNAGLDVVPEAEFVFFFDDDAVVRSDYVANGVAFFAAHPEVVGITGRVLLDGATGAEISRERADAALRHSATDPFSGRWRRTEELYGCNFAFRVSRSGGERLDPRLPLYSWLEDRDLARRLLRHGPLAVVDDCVIVHRGVKSGGRMAHERLGYSQVMNPAYLWRKGSFPVRLALRETVFRVGKNAVRAVAGTERSWRRERLRGNLRAGGDVLRGRFTPERITDLPAG